MSQGTDLFEKPLTEQHQYESYNIERKVFLATPFNLAFEQEFQINFPFYLDIKRKIQSILNVDVYLPQDRLLLRDLGDRMWPIIKNEIRDSQIIIPHLINSADVINMIREGSATKKQFIPFYSDPIQFPILLRNLDSRDLVEDRVGYKSQDEALSKIYDAVRKFFD